MVTVIKRRLELLLGQAKLLDDLSSDVLAVIAGTGGGKTVLGYWWLHSRMEKYPGYTWGMAEPTWGMLDKVILNSSDPDRPTLEQYFVGASHHPDYHKGERILKTDFGQIYLYTAENPDNMQGAPVKGFWLDEPGLMVLRAYETALQRCSMMRGQLLLTTTPYNLGWLKSEIAEKNGTNGIHVERWRSIDRPGFPRESYEAMKLKLPPWRFAMLYDAQFEHPEGLIYNAFNERDCLVDRFPIPKEWPVYVGHDFGAANPAALFYAIDPATGIKWLWQEYLPGAGLSAYQHVENWKKITQGYNVLVRMGGSHQEEEIRQLYSTQGWHIQEPNDVNKVETQILRVIGEHQRNRIKVFRDLPHYLDEKRTFSRKLGDDSKPTDKIDNEAAFHLMAAERYIISYFTPETVQTGTLARISNNSSYRRN